MTTEKFPAHLVLVVSEVAQNGKSHSVNRCYDSITAARKRHNLKRCDYHVYKNGKETEREYNALRIKYDL